uniref:Uncharacterized protein n=1 Tax=Anguilla anguilla TaxID=7936 RepID=A0A0E9V944_ANGAN
MPCPPPTTRTHCRAADHPAQTQWC